MPPRGKTGDQTHSAELGRLGGLVGFRLRRLQNRLARDFEAATAKLNLRSGLFSSLALIEANPGISQTALTAELGLDKSATVLIVDELEERGFATRQRLETDRRRHALQITPAGSRWLDRVFRALEKTESPAIKCLSDDETRQLHRLLDRMFSACRVLVLLASALFLAHSPRLEAAAPDKSFGQYRPADQFDSIASNSFFITMRDGVRLAVRVDRPARDGKAVDGRFPVLWHHSLSVSQEPGDGTGNPAQATRAMPRLVLQGYVVVQVARRGNGQSFGVRRGYHDRVEAHDAYEVMDWLASQPWSSGKLGIYGCSNTGDAGLHAVSMGHPALKAAFLGCFGWNKYDAMHRGGITAQWGTGPTRTVEEDMQVSPVDIDPAKRLLREAAEEHQLSTPLAQMWAQMPWRDSFSPLVASRFWAEGSASSYAPQIRRSGTALYIHGGWRDELRDQAFVTWLNVPGSRVTIGPWIHCNNEDFGLLEEAMRFFDHHLKGLDNGFANTPPIQYRTVNAPADKAWRTATHWPLPQQSMQAWQLGGTALLPPGAKANKDSASRSVEARPGLACEAAGSASTIQPCAKPGQGIVYASAPLKNAVEVTGNPDVSLWIEVDGEDAHVFAYLQDVAPDGTVSPVTEGRLRATLRAEHTAPYALPEGLPWHRAYAEDVLPLKAGEPLRLHFDMMPTSWLFQPGHRLQILVAGADHREKNRPATLGPRFRVLSDAVHPSTVKLPVIPEG